MRKIACTVLLLGFMTAGPTTLYAQDYKPELEKAALRQALEKQTSCNKDCAIKLSKMIFDEGTTTVLGGFGAMQSQKSPDVPKSIKKIGWYAFASSLYYSGKKIVGENAACYQSCDGLNQEIIRLGRSGLLGPMLNGDKINPQALDDGEVFKAFIKYVKPIPLPAEHRSKEWWDLVRRMS